MSTAARGLRTSPEPMMVLSENRRLTAAINSQSAFPVYLASTLLPWTQRAAAPASKAPSAMRRKALHSVSVSRNDRRSLSVTGRSDAAITARVISRASSGSFISAPPRRRRSTLCTGQAKFKSITSKPRSHRTVAARAMVSGLLPMSCPAMGWSRSVIREGRGGLRDLTSRQRSSIISVEHMGAPSSRQIRR